MTRHDATTLLRELRPEPTAHPDEDALERLLLEPPATPAARRDHRLARVAWRPVAATGAIALAVTVGVAALPDGQPGAPSILERAAAAVSKPDTILHYVATTQWKGAEPRTIESWQTTDGRRERTVFANGFEWARDHDARTYVSYDPARDRLMRHTDPGYFKAPADRQGIGGGFGFFSETQVGDLAQLLRRAAAGEDGVEQLPPGEIDGKTVDRVRITRQIEIADYDAPGAAADPRNAPTRTATTTREIAIDRVTALPVQYVDSFDTGGVRQTTTYSSVESLPRTAENEALLAMPEHPGAKTTTEGPVR